MARRVENANRRGRTDTAVQIRAAGAAHSCILLIEPVTEGAATAPIAPPAMAPIGRVASREQHGEASRQKNASHGHPHLQPNPEGEDGGAMANGP